MVRAPLADSPSALEVSGGRGRAVPSGCERLNWELLLRCREEPGGSSRAGGWERKAGGGAARSQPVEVGPGIAIGAYAGLWTLGIVLFVILFLTHRAAALPSLSRPELGSHSSSPAEPQLALTNTAGLLLAGLCPWDSGGSAALALTALRVRGGVFFQGQPRLRGLTHIMAWIWLSHLGLTGSLVWVWHRLQGQV
ncbi:hypothetical protein CB1_002454002 [Camelus ferus]|nr:hypothetical protein CB1_002454002 [Camelus ferus]